MSAKIYWAGDSTVKENTFISYPQTGIGQVLRLYLKRNVHVFDYAENGRSTKSFIAEGRLDLIDSQIKEGDFLFIQFGHNDEKEYDKDRYTTPYGTYTENLMKFVEVARKHNAHPVFITSLY
ncbi:MAG: GDSL family lipase, partial [Alphaproteobacteria bacterium]|nr:GDSL family lipase [Alphaproteobacteria bacterium]